MKKKQRCPHCHSDAPLVDCATCTRTMCEDCISYGDAGKVCGLCRDRELEEKQLTRDMLRAGVIGHNRDIT